MTDKNETIVKEIIEEDIDHSELRNRSPVPSYVIRELERLRNPDTGMQDPIFSYIPIIPNQGIYIREPNLDEYMSRSLLMQMTRGDTFYAKFNH